MVSREPEACWFLMRILGHRAVLTRRIVHCIPLIALVLTGIPLSIATIREAREAPQESIEQTFPSTRGQAEASGSAAAPEQRCIQSITDKDRASCLSTFPEGCERGKVPTLQSIGDDPPKLGGLCAERKAPSAGP